MPIERQTPDFVVITVILTNGLTIEHRYPVGQVRSPQEYERIMATVFLPPYEAMMGRSRARAFTLAYPVAVYNTAHVMTLRIREKAPPRLWNWQTTSTKWVSWPGSAAVKETCQPERLLPLPAFRRPLW